MASFFVVNCTSLKWEKESSNHYTKWERKHWLATLTNISFFIIQPSLLLKKDFKNKPLFIKQFLKVVCSTISSFVLRFYNVYFCWACFPWAKLWMFFFSCYLMTKPFFCSFCYLMTKPCCRKYKVEENVVLFGVMKTNEKKKLFMVW